MVESMIGKVIVGKGFDRAKMEVRSIGKVQVLKG